MAEYKSYNLHSDTHILLAYRTLRNETPKSVSLEH